MFYINCTQKGEKEEKREKERGKERGQAYLSLSITLEFFKLRKYMTNRNELQKACSGGFFFPPSAVKIKEKQF